MGHSKEPKVHFVYRRIEHHSEHSGYDQIVRYIPHEKIESTWLGGWIKGLSNIFKDRLINGTPLRWYTQDFLNSEAEAAGSFLSTGGHIFHVLYGENNFYYLGKIPNWRGNRKVVTFHQPPSFFPQIMSHTHHIKKADVVITLSKNQTDFFADLLGEDRVCFVPHGVDTDFFCPPLQRKRADVKKCLFVGHWMRDVKTLSKVIQIFEKQKKESVRFIIVTFRKYFELFKHFRNVDLYSGISEKDLLDLYQTSDLLFLPLWDSTANNSILEAMACGLPVVTTDIGGVRDYIDKNSAVLIPPENVEAAVETILNLLWDESKLKVLSTHVRHRAEMFSWAGVSEKMMEIYKKISH